MAVTTQESNESEPSFVFIGEVLAQGAATLDAVPLDAGTLVVGVVETMVSPDAVGPLDGFEVTVQLQPDQSADVGETYLFSADGWLFGDGVAVVCRGIEAPTENAISATLSPIAEKPMSALRQRVAGAELIVAGRITQIKEVHRRQSDPITEHDPQWLEATVAVESIEGSTDRDGSSPKRVKIRFASSNDANWSNAPKFAVGDRAIWLLGDKQLGAEMRSLSGAPPGQFTVTEGSDCLQEDSLDQLRQIMKEASDEH